MSRQMWQESLAWAVADGTAISNTTTETIIFPNVTIPANYMQDGRAIRLQAYGRWSIQAAANTLYFAVRWGGVSGTILAQSPNFTGSGSAITSAPWALDVILQTRSNGSSGSIFAMGRSWLSTGVGPTVGTVTNYLADAIMSSTGTTVPAAVTVDLTADTALSLTAKWGTANASNAVTGHVYTIESLN